jgi:hypothetical protein
MGRELLITGVYPVISSGLPYKRGASNKNRVIFFSFYGMT